MQEWQHENKPELLVAVRPHGMGLDMGLSNRTRSSLLRTKENA